jgi:exodeoxyribonuclease V alpha subunit
MLPWARIDPEKALPWVEKQIALALAPSQVAAIRLALTSKVLVMTGGPGVGKTTIVKAILRILAAKDTRASAVRPDWPRREARDRSDTFRGQDDPSSP